MTKTQTTKSQRAVLTALGAGTTFLTAQDIHAQLRRDSSPVGLTSVYRALQALADDGAVDVLRQPNGELAYRRCETQTHHHHLVCTQCGQAVEVIAPTLERWVAQIAREHDYHVSGHTLEITGTCRACSGG